MLLTIPMRRSKFLLGEKDSMRHWLTGAVILTLLLSTTGCTNPTISVDIHIKWDFPGSGAPTVTSKKTVAEISPDDVNSTADDPINALLDVEPTLTLSSSSPAQAVVTVTTDTGQTFVQTFALTQTSASSYTPAATGTNTYAFVSQNPPAVSAFLRSAAGNAGSKLSVAVETRATFQGPADGSEHTIYSRQYTSSGGVATLGSVSYIAPGGSSQPPSDVTSIGGTNN